MPIPTELVGSLPRPEKLQDAYQDLDDGKIEFSDLQKLQDEAAEDSIERLEQTGETYVTDGEQRESRFATYPITDTLAGTGLVDNLAGDGQFFAFFDDGHHRQFPLSRPVEKWTSGAGRKVDQPGWGNAGWWTDERLRAERGAKRRAERVAACAPR
ncbi:MAG: hypothetical protein ACR2IP_11365 [Solirubrobacteraceae bacterium]